MADVVRVGEQRLIGEILTMTGDSASIQVYEETSGLGPGAEVVTTGAPLSVELGPGLIENIYDASSVPWRSSWRRCRVTTCPAAWKCLLDREKKWEFTPPWSLAPRSLAATSLAPSRRPTPSSTRS